MSRNVFNGKSLIEFVEEKLSDLSNEEKEKFISNFRRRFAEEEKQKEKEENSIRTRVVLLSVLLIFQSASSFILNWFSELISQNILITMYLTMLVGAGGNAGNQAAVLMIRRLATSKYFPLKPIFLEQIFDAFFIGFSVASVGFLRVFLEENGAILPCLTIGLALFLIVFSSILLGSFLPIVLERTFGVDPAHGGPIIQVLMDILGVFIICLVGQGLLMDSTSRHEKDL